MEELILIVFILVVGIFGALAFSVVTWHVMFIETLRHDYPKTWKGLREPVFFSINPLKQIISIIVTCGFLWRRDYLALKDPKFTMVCVRLRRLYPALIGLFVLAALLFAGWVMAMGGA